MLKEAAFLLATNLAFAMGFGLLGLPYILGYIVTGMFLGPFIGMMAEGSHVLFALGELGMLMLLFVVGIDFDLIKFRKIWKQACLAVMLQLLFGFVLSYGVFFLVSYYFNIKFSNGFKLLIAFILPLSSTGVVVKLLDEMGEFGTSNGTMILSVLIVQDLILVPMMLILRGLTTQISVFQVAGNVLLASSILIALIIYLGQPYTRLFNPLKLIFSGKQEILTLASMTLCFVLASLSSFLGLSHAYGAFIGGLIIGSFANNREILQFAQPISSMLVMLFFVSVGMQVDLHYFSKNWKLILLFFTIFLIAKVWMNYVIMRIMGFSKKRSVFITTMLSQASEFAFILIAILADRILSKDHANLLTALVIISLTIGTFLPILGQVWYKIHKKKRS